MTSRLASLARGVFLGAGDASAAVVAVHVRALGGGGHKIGDGPPQKISLHFFLFLLSLSLLGPPLKATLSLSFSSGMFVGAFRVRSRRPRALSVSLAAGPSPAAKTSLSLFSTCLAIFIVFFFVSPGFIPLFTTIWTTMARRFGENPFFLSFSSSLTFSFLYFSLIVSLRKKAPHLWQLLFYSF